MRCEGCEGVLPTGFFLVLNCLFGVNFTNIMYISCEVEWESIVPSLGCTARATNSVVELVASRCQPTHLSVFVDWFGDALMSGFLLIAVKNGLMRITLKNVYVESSPTQWEFRTLRAPYPVLSSARLKASGKF